MKCILCYNKSVLVDSFKTSDLRILYKRYLKISPSQLVNIDKRVSLLQCKECGLKYFYPQIIGNPSFYEDLQKYDWYYLKNKDEYNYANQFIATKDKVLDVGCGFGEFAKIVSTKKYTGLEFNERAILHGEKNKINIIKQSAEKHSVKYNLHYDVVCAFQVLEHVQDPNTFIKSCLESLKKGGKLIFSIPSDDSFVGKAANSVLNLPPHHQTRWPDKTLKFIANLFSLKIVDVHHEPLSPIHFNSFVRLMISQNIERKIGKGKKVVDVGVGKHVIDTTSFYLAKLFSEGLKELSSTIYGHSVTVVYEKSK